MRHLALVLFGGFALSQTAFAQQKSTAPSAAGCEKMKQVYLAACAKGSKPQACSSDAAVRKQLAKAGCTLSPTIKK